MNKKIIPLICALSLGSFAALATNTVPQKTAVTQIKGSDADTAVTRKIRDRITDMDGLSTRAQNVTIVTVGNEITLNGEVDKQSEIQTIMNVAHETASDKSIVNNLRVHK